MQNIDDILENYDATVYKLSSLHSFGVQMI